MHQPKSDVLSGEGLEWTLALDLPISPAAPLLVRPQQPQSPLPARLQVACLRIPIAYNKNNKRDPNDDDKEDHVPENLAGPFLARKDSATTVPTRRRALVSLNSFSNLTGSSADNRPKNNIKGTSSNLFSRTENLPSSSSALSKAYLAAAQSIAPPGAYAQPLKVAFWAANRILAWSELVPNQPPPTTIPRIHFAQNISAICLNTATCSHTSMDLLVGFSTGDVLWIDPITARYNRFNKSAAVTGSAVTAMAWCPNYSNNSALTFLSCHADGTVITWSADREDPQANTVVIPPAHHWSEMSDMLVETPVPSAGNGDKKSNTTARTNPLQVWRVARKGLTGIAMSPDGRFAAITSDDGRLRLISLDQTRLLDTYCSYFGAMTCCAWSPDGCFILTGGQDDLVSIWSPSEQRLLARCQGHNSFVTGIAFEEINSSETQKRVLRFASVGEDCRVIFWDLSGAALHRPKLIGPHSQKRTSLNSTLSLISRKRTLDSQAHLPLGDVSEYSGPIFHPAPLRCEVSMLQPAMASPPADDLLSGLTLDSDIVLLTRAGQLRYFVPATPKRRDAPS